MQEEVEQKSLTLTVNAAKMTARLFRAAIAKYVAHKKEKKHDAQTGVRYVGRQSVKKLVGQNQGVSNVELSGEDTDIRIDSVIVGLEAKLAEMELGALFGLWVQSMFVGFTMWALAICIFIITYGRMIEIYLVTSVAPIPMATMANREWGQMGQNYLRSLFALGFQAFLIIICVAIYAILVRGIAVESDVSTAIWTCMGYTVLLCFMDTKEPFAFDWDWLAPSGLSTRDFIAPASFEFRRPARWAFSFRLRRRSCSKKAKARCITA